MKKLIILFVSLTVIIYGYFPGTLAKGSQTTFLDDEAGMAAWFLSPTSINLSSNLLQNQFKVIQVVTANYLIGSVQMYTDEVTVFIHSSGWVVAYYPKSTPSSAQLNEINDPTTRLEKVLAIIAHGLQLDTYTISFYNFRYPDANRLLLLGKSRPTYIGWNTFSINIPLGYTFFERGYYIRASNYMSAAFSLDDKQLASVGGGTDQSDFISAANFVPAAPHLIGIYNSATYWGDTYGGIALLYKDDQDTARFITQNVDIMRKIILTPPSADLLTAASDVPRVFKIYLASVSSN